MRHFLTLLSVCMLAACVQMPSDLQHCEDDVPCPPSQDCHKGWCLDPPPTGGTSRPDTGGGQAAADTGSRSDAGSSSPVDAGSARMDAGLERDSGPSTDTGPADAGGTSADAGALAPLDFDLEDVPVELGTVLWIGAPVGEVGRDPVDEVRHNVMVTHSYAIGRTEVTQAQWVAVMGENPSAHRGDRRPVENVSWLDAIEFANAASRLANLEPCYLITGAGDAREVVWTEGINCSGYRLPTEHEWELAGRADTAFRFAGSDNLDDVAWHRGNSAIDDVHQTSEVGLKAPNNWGLRDMTGNVFEWVWDRHGVYPDNDTIPLDYTGPGTGQALVRGCSFGIADPLACRLAVRTPGPRTYRSNDVGLRLARTTD